MSAFADSTDGRYAEAMDESAGRAQKSPIFLFLGDALCLALVTALGFATHQELAAVGETRFLTTFLPLLAGWSLTAGGLGAFDPNRAADPRQLWRPAVAVVVATPIAAVLRSAWLGTPPLAVFIAVMAGAILVGIGLWRAAYCLLRWDRLV